MFAAMTPLQNTRCINTTCTRLQLRYRAEARSSFSTAVALRAHCRYTITEVYLHEFSVRHYIEEGHHHTGGTHKQSGRPCPGSKSDCPISTNAFKLSGSAVQMWATTDEIRSVHTITDPNSTQWPVFVIDSVCSLWGRKYVVGALAQYREATIGFVRSVCLSVRPQGTTPVPMDGLSRNFKSGYFSKNLSRKFKFQWNLTITSTLHEDLFTFTIYRWIFLRMRNVSDKSRERIKTFSVK